MADGQSLISLYRQRGMPAQSTLSRWMARHPEFRRMYQDACAQRADDARRRGVRDPGAAGRPTRYSLVLAELICARMAEGESLLRICRTPGMPACASVFRWLGKREAFRRMYADAADRRAESLADEALEIADGALVDDGQTAPSRERLHWAKLRIDVRKWRVAILAPKVFGKDAADDGSIFTYEDYVLALNREGPAGADQTPKRGD